MKPISKTLLYLGLMGVLLLVFGMYSQPDFLMMLSNQIWSCF